MVIYLFNVLLLLGEGYYLIYTYPSLRNRKKFCLIASLQWIFLSGMRGTTVGADTIGYLRMFNRVGEVSWREILEAFVAVYFRGRVPLSSSENFLYKDPGYLIFQKFIHIFTNNGQMYLIIVAAIVFASLGYFIYKNSDDPAFSYVLFSALFYSFYAITGTRQALATVLVVFIGFEFIKRKEKWKFIFTALIAFTLHKSALLFVPFYFLAQKEITWKYIGLITAATAFFWLMGERFILTAAALFGYNRKSVYVADTLTYTAIMALVGIAVVFFFKWIQKRNEFKKMELNATLLATALTFFTLIDQSMMRVQQYYALFLMLSIPSILNCFEKKSRRILRGTCILVLIFYLIRNNPQYMFFWQN